MKRRTNMITAKLKKTRSRKEK